MRKLHASKSPERNDSGVVKITRVPFFTNDSPERLAPALLANWRTWMRAKRTNVWINQFLRQRKLVDGLGRTFNRRRLFQASYNESEARVSHFFREGVA